MSLYNDFLFLKSLFSRVRVPLDIITTTEHKRGFFRSEIIVYYRVAGTNSVTFVHFSSLNGDRLCKEINHAVADLNNRAAESLS